MIKQANYKTAILTVACAGVSIFIPSSHSLAGELVITEQLTCGTLGDSERRQWETAAASGNTAALNNLVQSSTGVKEYNVHFAGAIIAALPTLFVYIVAGRYFVRGLMAGSVKG